MNTFEQFIREEYHHEHAGMEQSESDYMEWVHTRCSDEWISLGQRYGTAALRYCRQITEGKV